MEGEREGEKHQCEKETSVWCPDQELNLGPFSLWDDAQPTQPAQLGPGYHFEGCGFAELKAVRECMVYASCLDKQSLLLEIC